MFDVIRLNYYVPHWLMTNCIARLIDCYSSVDRLPTAVGGKAHSGYNVRCVLMKFGTGYLRCAAYTYM